MTNQEIEIARALIAKLLTYSVSGNEPPPKMSADNIIFELESVGLQWSLDYTGNMREARIWAWPTVVGRYRPHKAEPLSIMLWKALIDAKDFPLPR